VCANLIALKYREVKEGASPSGDSLIDQQYSGNKGDLRPTFDAIIDAVMAFREDVEIAPKKAYTSLRRNKQFGIVQPSTKSRIDVGINLKGFDEGLIVESGTPHNVFHNPQEDRTKLFLSQILKH